jgi:hypothetical protein
MSYMAVTSWKRRSIASLPASTCAHVCMCVRVFDTRVSAVYCVPVYDTLVCLTQLCCTCVCVHVARGGAYLRVGAVEGRKLVQLLRPGRQLPVYVGKSDGGGIMPLDMAPMTRAASACGYTARSAAASSGPELMS